MNRNKSIETIDTYDGYWDILVIGGGATGLGCALDAALPKVPPAAVPSWFTAVCVTCSRAISLWFSKPSTSGDC